MIAVLGSNSFMGSTLVDALLTKGYDVMGVGRTVKHDLLKPYLTNDRVSSFVEFRYNINEDCDAIIDLLKQSKPNVVINCIALGIVDTSWDIPFDYFTTNCVSLSKVVHYLNTCDYLDKFLQASTPELYGNIPDNFVESKVYNPTTPYAASKASFDMYLDVVNRQYGFPSIMFRSANLYGANQQLFRIVPKTLIQIHSHGKLLLDGGGLTRRYFTHSSDLSDGVIRLIDSGKTGEIYHFAGGEYITMRGLVERICSLTGYDFESLVEDSPDRRGKDIEYNLNCDKAIRELGWCPKVSLNDGILMTDAWISDNWQEIEKLCNVR